MPSRAASRVKAKSKKRTAKGKPAAPRAQPRAAAPAVKAAERDLLTRLKSGAVICAEGYVFELERRGYLQAGAFVPEVLFEHPEVVEQLHLDFVHAGSDVTQALTYYVHREKLRVIGREKDLGLKMIYSIPGTSPSIPTPVPSLPGAVPLALASSTAPSTERARSRTIQPTSSTPEYSERSQSQESTPAATAETTPSPPRTFHGCVPPTPAESF